MEKQKQKEILMAGRNKAMKQLEKCHQQDNNYSSKQNDDKDRVDSEEEVTKKAKKQVDQWKAERYKQQQHYEKQQQQEFKQKWDDLQNQQQILQQQQQDMKQKAIEQWKQKKDQIENQIQQLLQKIQTLKQEQEDLECYLLEQKQESIQQQKLEWDGFQQQIEKVKQDQQKLEQENKDLKEQMIEWENMKCEDDGFYQAFEIKVYYVNRFRQSLIGNDDIVNVVKNYIEVRRRCIEKEYLEELFKEIEEKGGQIQILNSFLNSCLKNKKLEQITYYDQLRVQVNLEQEQIEQLQDSFKQMDDLEDQQEIDLSNSFKLRQIDVNELYQFFKLCFSISRMESIYVEQLKKYVQGQFEQNIKEKEILKNLGIPDNNISLRKYINEILYYDVGQDEFKSILDLALNKKYFLNQQEFQHTINERKIEIIEFMYFVYVFEPEIYQKFRNIIENNEQIAFMKDSLIEKIENQKKLKSSQIYDYPHLMIYFCQKNRDDERYRYYIKNILDDSPQWFDLFKTNSYLLQFITVDKKFKLDKSNIKLLNKYSQQQSKYLLNNISFGDILEILKRIHCRNKQFLRQYIEGLNQNINIKINFEQYQQNFNFEYIKDNQHRYMLFPYIGDDQFKVQKLEDFNSIWPKIDKEELLKDIRTVVDGDSNDNKDKDILYQKILRSVYGCIKRGEDLQCCFVQPLVEQNIFDRRYLTSKYLQSYLLQRSDTELRTKLMVLMSNVFAVPLIANRLIKYREQEEFEKEYFGELSLMIEDGIGILNFGIGELGSAKCGKTQLFSELMCSGDNQKSWLHIDEQNIMNRGTVDILFGNIWSQKKNLVLMDGQGAQDIEVLKRCANVCNVLMVHVSYEQIRSRITPSIEEVFVGLKQMKDLQDDLKVFFMVRDCEGLEVVKKYSEMGCDFKGIQFLQQYDDIVDFCIKIPNLKSKSQVDQSVKQIREYIGQCLDEFSDPQDYRFTQQNYVDKFMDGLKDQKMFKDIVGQIDKLMQCIENVKENVMDPNNGVYVLQLLGQKKIIKKEIGLIQQNVRVNSNSNSNENSNQNSYLEKKQQLEQIEEQIQQQVQKQCQIVDEFQRLVMGQYSVMKQQCLQIKLNKFIIKNLEDVMSRLQENDDQIVEVIDGVQNVEDQKCQDKEQKQKKGWLLDNVRQKQLGLESLWKCLFYRIQGVNDQEIVSQFYSMLGENVLKGQYLQLIDGDNLEFRKEMIEQLFRNIKGVKESNVVSIGVIGEQQSTKNQLIKFFLGLQSIECQVRYESGVYLNVQRLAEKIEYEGKSIEYLLVWDIEGLQNQEREDGDEFDRMITTFVLMNCNIVICSSQTGFSDKMKQMLEISIVCLHQLKQNSIDPWVYFTFGSSRSKESFQNKLRKMQNNVINASPDLKDTAQLLAVEQDRIFTLGNAFKNERIQKNVDKDIELTVVQQDFSRKTGILQQQIFRKIEEDIQVCNDSKYRKMAESLNNAGQSWSIIENCMSKIAQHDKLTDIKNMLQWNKQYQKALDYIKDNVDIDKKVDESFKDDQNSSKFQDYLSGIVDNAYREYIEKWLKSNPRVCEVDINQAKFNLEQQVGVYQKMFEKELNDRIIQIRIDKSGPAGIVGLRWVCQQIKDDSVFNELKKTSYNEYVKKLEKEFYQYWYKEKYSIRNEAQDSQMIEQQCQIIFNRFRQEYRQMPKLDFKVFGSNDIESYVFDLLAKESKVLSDIMYGEKFDLDNKQVVKSELQDRLQDKYNQEKYVRIEKFFLKKYIYKCIDPVESINKYKNDITNYMVNKLLDAYKLWNNGPIFLIKDDQQSYQKKKQELKNALEVFINSGYQLRFSTHIRMRYYEFQISDNFDQDIDGLFHILDTNKHKIKRYDINLEIQYIGIGKFDKQLERFVDIDVLQTYVKDNLVNDHQYRWSNILNEILMIDRKQKDMKNLFMIDKVIYSVDENAIKNNLDQFDNKKMTLKKYLDTFINLNNSNLSSVQKKIDLSKFMDKLIDWKKLVNKLKSGVIEILKVDDDMLNSKGTIFHQIPDKQYQQIYKNVIEKQIKAIDDELGQICGLKLTKDSQELITYCGFLFVIEQLIKIQNQKKELQIKSFNNNKLYYFDIFMGSICEDSRIISQSDAQMMTELAFEKLMVKKKDSICVQVMNGFKQPSFIKKYDFHSNYQSMLRQMMNGQLNSKKVMKYFDDPTTYYQNEMVWNQYSLDQYLDEYQVSLDTKAYDVLSKTKIHLLQFKECLAQFLYKDSSIQCFFQFYKNGNLLDTKQFENVEKDNMSADLLRFYLDILFCKYEKMMGHEIRFEIGSDIYIIKIQIGFDNIYRMYYSKVEDKDQIGQGWELLDQFKEMFYQDCGNYKVVDLKAMVDGMLQQIQMMEYRLEQYTGYQNCQQLVASKEQIIQQMKGCSHKCSFCNVQCQVGWHNDNIKHSCDRYGHNLRVFAGGMFKSYHGIKYVSLQTCNVIPASQIIGTDKLGYNWTDIQQIQQSGFTISYDKMKYGKVQQKLMDKVWSQVGKEYCKQNGVDYIDSYEIEYSQMVVWYEPLHLIFCLDCSDFMQGDPWDHVKKAAVSLISKVKNQHQIVRQCRVSVIVFCEQPNIKYQSDLLSHELQLDQMFNYTGGVANFENVFGKVYELLQQHFQNYTNNKIIFYTNSNAESAADSVAKICQFVKDKKQSLEVKLYCGTEENKEMEEVDQMLNNVRDGVCELKVKIRPEELEKQIVQMFQFPNQ